MVASIYAPDAVLQAANMPQLEGREAILQAYHEYFSEMLELHGSPTKILVASSCQMAVEYGWNRIVFDTPMVRSKSRGSIRERGRRPRAHGRSWCRLTAPTPRLRVGPFAPWKEEEWAMGAGKSWWGIEIDGHRRWRNWLTSRSQ